MGTVIKTMVDKLTGDTVLLRTSTAAVTLADGTTTIDDRLDELDTTLSNMKSVITVTLLAANWAGSVAPYTQIVGVTGMTANINPSIAPNYSTTNATAALQRRMWNRVGKITTGAGIITAYCFEEKPTMDIPLRIKGVI